MLDFEENSRTPKIDFSSLHKNLYLMKLSKFQFFLVFSCDGPIKLTNC